MTTLNLDLVGRDRGASKLLKDIARESTAAKTGLDKMKQSAEALTGAERRLADASGAVRVAEARLQQVRANSRSTTAHVVAAEENLARAQRRLSSAQKDVSGSRAAAKALVDVGREAGQADTKLDRFRRAMGRANDSAGGFATSALKGARSFAGLAAGAAKFVGVGVGIAAGAAAIGLTKAINKAGDFDKTMRTVGATLGVSGKGLQDLTALAIEMGAKTSFSAKGASDAMSELAKGGLTSAQIQGGALQKTLTLATAGGLELGDAAGYMVNGLTAFNLKAKDAGRVASALAGGANASTASVQDMGYAFQATSASAAAAGLTIEDTAAAVAALANNGIKGSDAGTSLKTMLAALQPQSKTTASAMEDLGLVTEKGGNAFFNAKGEIKSMTEISGLLSEATKDLSNQEKTRLLRLAFGSDAVRAAIILAKEGKEGLEEYTKATSDQQAAENLAKTATEGYAGALERIKGSIETLQIVAGQKFLPGITATFTRISDWIEKNQGSLDSLFDVAAETAGAFGRGVSGAFGAFTSSLTGGQASFEAFTDSIVGNQADIITGMFDMGESMIGFGETSTSQISAIVRWWGTWERQIGSNLDRMADFFGTMADNKLLNTFMPPGFQTAMRNLSDGLHDQAGKYKEDADRAAGLADTLSGKVSPALKDAHDRARELSKQAVLRVQQRESAEQFATALERVGKVGKLTKDELASFSREVTTGTTRQIRLRDRLDEARDAFLRSYKASDKSKQGQEAFHKAAKKSEDQLYKELRALGLDEKAAHKYADEITKVPKKHDTKYSHNAKATQSATHALHREIDGVPKHPSIKWTVNWDTRVDSVNTSLKKAGGAWAFQAAVAEGGPIPGRGAKGVDSIPILAAPGEHMWTAKEVDAVGGHQSMHRIRRAALDGALPRFSTGGEVNRGGTRAIEGAGEGALTRLFKKYADMGGGLYGSGGLGPQGRGMAAAARAGHRMGASYVAFHRDPSGYPSFDMGSSGTLNSRIAAHLLSNHVGYGIRYVISQMRIASARSNWRWRGYTPITGSGDFRHVAHVHSSYFDRGGMLYPGRGAVNASRQPERILTGQQTRSFEHLVQLMDRRGGAASTTIIINAPNYVGSTNDLRQTLVTMARRGELEVTRR